jgi:hypothetical protein
MPAVSFVSIQCQLLSYETGLTPGSAQNARKTHIFVPGAKFGCFRFLVGPEKSGRAMKMRRVRWSVVVPVLMMAGWLSLYVIFIGIGSL